MEVGGFCECSGIYDLTHVKQLARADFRKNWSTRIRDVFYVGIGLGSVTFIAYIFGRTGAFSDGIGFVISVLMPVTVLILKYIHTSLTGNVGRHVDIELTYRWDDENLTIISHNRIDPGLYTYSVPWDKLKVSFETSDLLVLEIINGGIVTLLKKPLIEAGQMDCVLSLVRG